MSLPEAPESLNVTFAFNNRLRLHNEVQNCRPATVYCELDGNPLAKPEVTTTTHYPLGSTCTTITEARVPRIGRHTVTPRGYILTVKP